MDVVFNELNEDTIEAIKEARSGKSAGVIHATNFSTFKEPTNNIKWKSFSTI